MVNRKAGKAATALALLPLVAPSLALLLLFAPLARVGAQQPAKVRGITPEDYFAFEFVGDPRLSPDGKLVAYVLTTIDQRQNRRQSQIWLASTDGSRPPRQLTSSQQSSTSPRWSPDGHSLAFISARPWSDVANSAQRGASQGTPTATATPTPQPAPGANAPQATPTQATPQTTPAPNVTATTPGVPSALQTTAPAPESQPRAQVWLLPLEGGEARRLTNLRNGVSTFEWSPDGKRLVLTSRTGPSDAKPPSSDVRHYKHLSYKFNDTGWFDDKRSHLWVADLANGAARQITSGEDWNDTDPQWSPDSTRLAFVSDRSGHAFDESRNTDVWVVSSEGGALTKISDHPEEDYSPRWSPDGKQLAFLGRLHETDHPKIFLAPSSGGTPSRNLSPTLDLIPSNLTWAERGRALYFETGVRGEQHLFRVDASDGTLKQVTRGA
ncbi:MAG: DPP IV N-terminal domain-containing protein, partial [Acidobacteriota bacterium]|nr:DPP IV N-terminal domain-containing protein [Acidobacteriota bacterium]